MFYSINCLVPFIDLNALGLFTKVLVSFQLVVLVQLTKKIYRKHFAFLFLHNFTLNPSAGIDKGSKLD